MLPPDFLHCLTIDFAGAPEPEHVAFELPADELRDLLCHAARHGAPLIVLFTTTALTLISTTQHHLVCFRPVLARLRERLPASDGWRALPARSASGSEAARQLLRQAFPPTRVGPLSHRFTRRLHAAAELSAVCGALNGETVALVRMAEHAAERVWEETSLGRPGASLTETALELLAAERIVEEELLAWQSSDPALRSSRPPLSETDEELLGPEQRHSHVRIKLRDVLAKFRSA